MPSYAIDPESGEVIDKAELEVRKELKRLGVKNDPRPLGDKCPKCGKEMKSVGGMVGEEMLLCEEHGIQWTDNEGAIRRVY